MTVAIVVYKGLKLVVYRMLTFMQHPGIYIRNVHFQYQEMIAFLYIFSLILYGVIAFFAETY